MTTAAALPPAAAQQEYVFPGGQSDCNCGSGSASGLEMIYEADEAIEVSQASSSASSSSAQQQLLLRSRSLPQDEFRYLARKLRELERTDSELSGNSARWVSTR